MDGRRSFRSLVLDTTRSDNPMDANLAQDPNPQDQNSTPSFLTQQSLASFPVATGIITAISKFIGEFLLAGQPLAATAWVPLAIAALIILIALAATWGNMTSAGQRVAAVGIGVLNALLLAAAAVGVDVTVLSGTTGST